MTVLSGQAAEILRSEYWDETIAALRISPEDRDGPMPLWALVATRLEQLIANGRVPQGSHIENEVALAEKLGISRPTVRRALQQLVDKGLLVRKPGVGTQVVSGNVRRPVQLTSLYDDLLKSGREPATEVLSLDVVPASDGLSMSLRIPPRSDVTSLRRLRLANGEPLALMTNMIPLSVVRLDREDLDKHGLYECIRAAGGPLPTTATELIGARIATPEECGILGLTEGSAVLTMTRTAWGSDGRGIEYGSHIYRADRYAFEHQVNNE